VNMTKTVELQTTAGTIRLELDDAKAPITVANFLEYVKAGHYDGTIFTASSRASWFRAVASSPA